MRRLPLSVSLPVWLFTAPLCRSLSVSPLLLSFAPLFFLPPRPLPAFIFTAHVKLTTNVEHMPALPLLSHSFSLSLSPLFLSLSSYSPCKFHSMSVQLHARFPLPAASAAATQEIKNAWAKQKARKEEVGQGKSETESEAEEVRQLQKN